jgi:hypothetical protein
MIPQIFLHYWVQSIDEIIVLQCSNHSKGTSKACESDLSTSRIPHILQKQIFPTIIISDHYYFKNALNVAG